MLINSDHKILAQEEIIEKLRLEIVGLTQERDNLILGNKELIRGRTEVFNVTNSKSQELYTIESIIEETQKAFDKSSVHFYNLTEKQRAKLQELSTSIQNRLDELAIQEGKELIDIDSLNRKSKLAIGKKNRELQEVTELVEANKKTIELANRQLEKAKKKLDIEKKELLEFRSNLEKREQKIVLSEKRLEKYKAELLSKK